MARMEASKLARGFGAALDRVLAGETIEVERYGRVVAVLGPAKRKPEPRTVQPEKLGTAVLATPGESATARQRRIDDLLSRTRKGGQNG